MASEQIIESLITLQKEQTPVSEAHFYFRVKEGKIIRTSETNKV